MGKLLGYTGPKNLSPEFPLRTALHLPQLAFPGWQIFVGFEWFVNFRTRYRNVVDSDQIHTWFNQWQILNNYTNPMQIENLMPVLMRLVVFAISSVVSGNAECILSFRFSS